MDVSVKKLSEILKIDPNVLLDGKDALRIYQDYSCLVAKEVVIGLNMKFETKHNNISDNLPVVIGYALDHYCDYKGIVAGYKWIVMDEL